MTPLHHFWANIQRLTLNPATEIPAHPHLLLHCSHECLPNRDMENAFVTYIVYALKQFAAYLFLSFWVLFLCAAFNLYHDCCFVRKAFPTQAYTNKFAYNFF